MERRFFLRDREWGDLFFPNVRTHRLVGGYEGNPLSSARGDLRRLV
jgi:hypothetical protein